MKFFNGYIFVDDEVIAGEEAIINKGYRTEDIVLVTRFAPECIYAKVKDKETGVEWEVMANRLTALKNKKDKNESK